MELEKIKKEYLHKIERERENLKYNRFKDRFFKVLDDLEKRIKEFKGGNIILLSDLGKENFKGGNVEVLGEKLFKKPNSDFDFEGNTQYFKIVTLHSREDKINCEV